MHAPAREFAGRARVHGTRVAPRIVAALCLAGAVYAARTASDEWTVARIDAAMRGGDASAAGAVFDAYADTPADALPDRAAAGLAALALAGAADARVPGQRALYRARARTLIDALRHRRADWLATRLLDAQQQLADAGAATPRAIADVAASYRAAPFLRDEARWRIAFGALYWRQLPPATRIAVIDEAEWLTSYDAQQRAGVEALLGDTPAGVAYQMRMARRGGA